MMLDAKLDTPKETLLTTLYFTLQGIGCLISFNAFTTGMDYFNSCYPGENSSFKLPLAFNTAQLIMTVLTPKLSGIIPLKYRIFCPLLVVVSGLFFLPFEAHLLSGTTLGFLLLMLMLFIMGALNCIYQASMSGFMSLFPGKCTSLFLMGQGFAGLSMNALRALSIVSFNQYGFLVEVIIYFIAAGFILGLCMLIHPFFMRSHYCKVHAHMHYPENDMSQVVPELEEALNDPEATLTRSTAESVEGKKNFKTLLSVFKDVKLYVFLLFFNYIETFLVYPGVMFEKPMGHMDPSWKTVSTLATFNIFAILGKGLGKYRKTYTKNRIIVLIFLRLFLVAFFIIQACRKVVVFETIWFAYINIALFGLTNGFATTALFILGAERVEGWKKEVSGFLSVFGLSIGIFLGGFIALPMAHLGDNYH